MATTTVISELLKDLAETDLFKEARQENRFVGRPFYLDFARLRLLSNDKWKNDVSGLG
jgi:hypothetical protein